MRLRARRLLAMALLAALPAAAGAQPRPEDVTERPEMVAAFRSVKDGGLPALARLVDQQPDFVYWESRYRETPLFWTVWWDNPKLAEFLLRRGADINARNADGGTPLWDAADRGHPRMVRFLLDHGADPNAPGRYGQPPLFAAALSGSSESIVALLSHGADASAVDRYGNNALHCAARACWGEGARELIRHGARIEARDPDGNTPLLLALTPGPLCGHVPAYSNDPVEQARNTRRVWNHRGFFRPDAVAALLEAGADTMAANKSGQTPWGMVVEDMARMVLFEIHRAPVTVTDRRGETPLHLAARASSGKVGTETMEALFRRGAKPDARSRTGATPLHVAAEEGSPAAVKLLLDSKAPVNARDNRGATPLHIAARRGWAETVRLLLAGGADPAIHDGQGRTAALSAMECPDVPGREAVLRILKPDESRGHDGKRRVGGLKQTHGPRP